MSRNLLTWRKATIELQFEGAGSEAAGRRLKKAVLAREVQLGKQIATRLGSGPRPKMRITLSAVMRWLPELRRSRVDRLSDALREFNADTDRRVTEIVTEQLAESVEPRLEELWQRDEKLAIEFEGLTKRVNGISRAVSRVNRSQKNRPASTGIDHG